MKIVKDVTELIGNTPIIDITEYYGTEARILAKLEMFNPLSSVKDRVAFAMIDDAEKRGILRKGDVIIEPTSGNTGIGLAFVAAIRGYKLILTMPESMSIERRKLVAALGAQVVLTDAGEGMEGAVKKAEELAGKTDRAFIPQQFSNPANAEIHRKTTAEEILRDTDGDVDIFVSGVGTGGTLTGVGEILKKNNPQVKIVAVEPSQSAVLSGKKHSIHKIQGIGAGFIPDVLNRSIIDEIIQVYEDDAGDAAREIAKKHGLLIGISSGASLCAALVLAKRPENKGKTVLTVFPDSGERYLSTWLFDTFDKEKNSADKSPADSGKSAAELSKYYFLNGLSCSEAVLRAFNEIYHLGLPENCYKISSGFGAGLGESGCACGAFTGCAMVFGLIAGREKVNESNRMAFLAVNKLHELFKKQFKAACCRILTKDFEWTSAERKAACENYVFTAASLADEIIQTRLSDFIKRKD
jgi:cysteine synthase